MKEKLTAILPEGTLAEEDNLLCQLARWCSSSTSNLLQQLKALWFPRLPLFAWPRQRSPQFLVPFLLALIFSLVVLVLVSHVLTSWWRSRDFLRYFRRTTPPRTADGRGAVQKTAEGGSARRDASRRAARSNRREGAAGEKGGGKSWFSSFLPAGTCGSWSVLSSVPSVSRYDSGTTSSSGVARLFGFGGDGGDAAASSSRSIKKRSGSAVLHAVEAPSSAGSTNKKGPGGGASSARKAGAKRSSSAAASHRRSGSQLRRGGDSTAAAAETGKRASTRRASSRGRKDEEKFPPHAPKEGSGGEGKGDGTKKQKQASAEGGAAGTQRPAATRSREKQRLSSRRRTPSFSTNRDIGARVLNEEERHVHIGAAAVATRRGSGSSRRTPGASQAAARQPSQQRRNRKTQEHEDSTLTRSGRVSKRGELYPGVVAWEPLQRNSQ